ncbi:MAG: hypothetical protein ABWZ25_00590 [Chitinophagaceae bacterium]
MKHYNDPARIETLLHDFFGDEGIEFAIERFSDFFTYVFSDPYEREEPATTRLLSIHCDITKLIDVAYLIPDNLRPAAIISPDDFGTLIKQIRAGLKSWDEFPSHLKPQEWLEPEIVIAEFFELQTVDEWKSAAQGLLQSAITDSSVSECISEIQLGFVVLQMYRLLEAVWLLKISDRIRAVKPVNVEEPEVHFLMASSQQGRTTGREFLNSFNPVCH